MTTSETAIHVIRRAADVEYETVDAAEGMRKGVLLDDTDGVPASDTSGGSSDEQSESDGAPHFAMRRFVLDAGASVPEHTNEVEHEQYVLAGEYTVGIDGEEYTVSAGDSLLIPAGAVHWYDNPGNEEGAFVCVVPNGDDTIELVE
ncbi:MULTISPECIES: cupin domain-containing protein [Halobacterium]|uniref:cupin domain-containing protein n=1 Tax=Halobacterium TaxID=2239 RepID=UPI00073F33E9|nr:MULTISPECIES: cupin domain-containing protein [Halobacterium]MCG1004263.1 cupin domain-containing protein [Halobacterium noricense]